MSHPHASNRSHATGPFSWLHPTAWRSPLTEDGKPIDQQPIEGADLSKTDGNNEDDVTRSKARSSETQFATKVERHWKSRDNRKGRHALLVTAATDEHSRLLAPKSTHTISAALAGIWRMCTIYPYWDVSYLVAVVFTLGSIVWCINGFFIWLPDQIPSSEFDTEVLYGGGITAFIGATIFEFGSVLLMIEAVNENRSDCFGWAIEEALEEHGFLRVREGNCTHHHVNKHAFITGSAQNEAPHPSRSPKDRTWTWLPTLHEISTHYLHEIGFLACLFQFLGASIFWISGFTALPGIQNKLSTAGLNGAYWAPQVIGGSGFIISGVLFMLECQKTWYRPALSVLGWHIGAWNLIGAIGFTLSGALGYCTGSGELYQGGLATFWGSWAFLIGSVVQWFEALDKHPVEVERDGGRADNVEPKQ